MKKLFAFLLVAILASASAFAVDYCHDEASGKFTFTVEPAIDIELTSQDVDLGDVCPGCSVDFEIGAKCLVWEVTGGATCYFTFTIPTPQWPSFITATQVWQQNYNNAGWVTYVQDNKLMGDGWELRKCITKLEATCEAEVGDEEVTYLVEVDYVCL